jgi:mRNA interferase MazF
MNRGEVWWVEFDPAVERVYSGNALVTIGSSLSKAMADQMMTADKARLKSKLGSLSKSDMQLVDEAMSLQLGLRK